MHTDSTNTIWLLWNQNTAITAATSNIVNPWYDEGTTASITQDWTRWVTLQEETAEQRVERQRRQAEQDQRTRDYAAARKAAAERAEKLLEACLTSGQRDSLQKNGWFVVYTKSGRGYQIRRGRARNVIEVSTRRTYCCHPVDNVPDADTMLAQKLMLESAEEEFLRLANVS